MTRGLILVLATTLVTGCAYRPIVDPARSDMARFDSDLAECREIADKGPGAGGAAAVGAVAGYAVGQVAARATGHSGVANEVGRGGAVVGGAKGAGAGARGKRAIIRNCLTGRGHAVLN
jgi:hypothetical protein